MINIEDLETQSNRNSYTLLRMAFADKSDYTKIKKSYHKKFFRNEDIKNIYNIISSFYEKTNCQNISVLHFDDCVNRGLLNDTQKTYFKRILESTVEPTESIEDMCSTINKIDFALTALNEGVYTEDYIMKEYTKALTDKDLHKSIVENSKNVVKVCKQESGEAVDGGTEMINCFQSLFAEEDGLEMSMFPYVSECVGGWVNGVTYLGGQSGTGKSTIAITSFGLDVLKNPNEKLLYIANEQTEKTIINMFSLAYYNNVMLPRIKDPKEREEKTIPRYFLKKKYITSKLMNDKGEYNQRYYSFVESLIEASKEIGDRFKVLYLSGFDEDTIERVAEEYIEKGYTNIVLDTFKHSDENSAEGWKALSSLATRADAIAKKHSNKNTRIVATIQLKASSAHRKFLTVDCIGKATQIKETAETMVLFRKVLPHEKTNLKYIRTANGNAILEGFDETKEYFLFFVDKSRNGQSGDVVAVEYDFDLFKFVECGKVLNIENDSQR